MGATSVTGVGPGAADGLHKGPGNGRNVFVPLQTPHVVAAGTATVPGGLTVTVTFPTQLDDTETEFAVLVIGETDATAFVSAKTDNANGHFASFDITAGAAQDVMWVVVKNGWA
jgi:hypothetical protein